jgi:hypothetical protein
LEHDKAHYENTIKLKDQKIAFLQAHIAQLTQSMVQFALRLGDEEIKKKGLVAVLEIGSSLEDSESLRKKRPWTIRE